MKIISYCMVIIFAVAAIVQYNDPDPLLWILIYVATAIITLFFISTDIKWYIPATAMLLALLGSAFLGYEALQNGFMASSLETWEMQNPAEEKAREAGGLLIIALWMLVMTVKSRKTV